MDVEVVKASFIKSIVKKRFGFFTGVTFRDELYKLYPYGTIANALSSIDPIHEPVPDFYDCNAQSDEVIAKLRRNLLGAAVMYVYGIGKMGKVAHGWAAVVDSNRDIYSIHISRQLDGKYRPFMQARGKDNFYMFPRSISIRF